MEIEIDIARSLDDALDRLARAGPDLRPVAGATDVLLRLEAGKLPAKALLAIDAIPGLAYVRESGDGLEVGALTLVADLVGDARIRERAPCLAQAAREFASPQIRNRATVGGNIGNASPAADLVPPLIALGAQLVLARKGADRVLPLEDFFLGFGKTSLQPGELITAVRLPAQAPGFQAFAKFGARDANIIAVVNMAMRLELAGGTVKDARVAYGCCAPKPLRALCVEAHLEGKALDAALIRTVKAAVLADVRPIDDVRGSARYKAMLAVNATEDALERARSHRS